MILLSLVFKSTAQPLPPAATGGNERVITGAVQPVRAQTSGAADTVPRPATGPQRPEGAASRCRAQVVQLPGLTRTPARPGCGESSQKIVDQEREMPSRRRLRTWYCPRKLGCSTGGCASGTAQNARLQHRKLRGPLAVPPMLSSSPQTWSGRAAPGRCPGLRGRREPPAQAGSVASGAGIRSWRRGHNSAGQLCDARPPHWLSCLGGLPHSSGTFSSSSSQQPCALACGGAPQRSQPGAAAGAAERGIQARGRRAPRCSPCRNTSAASSGRRRRRSGRCSC